MALGLGGLKLGSHKNDNSKQTLLSGKMKLLPTEKHVTINQKVPPAEPRQTTNTTDITKMALGKGIALNSVKNTVLNVRGVRPSTRSAPEITSTLKTKSDFISSYPKSTKGMEDGKIYLRLPKRAKKPKQISSSLDFLPEQRLYTSSISMKPWTKQGKTNKLFKSNLSLKLLIKEGKMASNCLNIKSVNLPSHVKKVLPLIKSLPSQQLTLRV